MWKSVPVLVSLVFLAFIVAISGVQGQSFGTCATLTGDIPAANDFFNSQKIFSILCENRSAATLAGFNLNPNFTSLCAALATQPEIMALLNNPAARITFFAPDNTAFVAINTSSLTPAQLRAILEMHIICQPLLMSNLRCDECICTVEGTLSAFAPCRTQTKTLCTDAGQVFQVGGGNVGVGGVQSFPQIGQPTGSTQVFFQGFDNTGNLVSPGIHPWGTGSNNIIRGNQEGFFSEDALACNGIIHAVNRLILPGVGFNNRHCGGIIGGENNTALGVHSFVGAGNGNSATNYGSFVGAGRTNIATWIDSAVVSGSENTANGICSFIGAGSSNAASGYYAAIIGGEGNTALGDYSIAMGFKADANKERSVVINLGKNGKPVSSNKKGEFLVQSNFFTIQIGKKKVTINKKNINNFAKLLNKDDGRRHLAAQQPHNDEQHHSSIMNKLQQYIEEQQVTNKEQQATNKEQQATIDEQQGQIEKLQEQMNELYHMMTTTARLSTEN